MAELNVGKRVRQAVYLHTSLLVELDPPYHSVVENASSIAGVGRADFNVVKFMHDSPRVSLLRYRDFFATGFPQLECGWTVNLNDSSATERSYEAEENPPILHRKETLLSEDHPLQREFAALTATAEEAGLFERGHEIGRKAQWDAKLQRIGLAVRGNRLVEAETSDEDENIQRHRTALVRYSLSSPMQTLWRYGYLDGDYSVFDYGCGRGDDVRALADRGLDVSGWDPHFAPEEDRTPADIVNLGFVLNVIEDQTERKAALRGAWELADKLLVVAVLTGGKAAYERYRLYRDGVVTSRGTFQKYFRPAELRDYVSSVLEREPIALAPGIVFAFKSDDDEQRFLADRQTTRGPRSSLPQVPDSERPRVRTKRASKSRWVVHRELLEAFRDQCLNLGRAPEVDEFSRSAEVRDKLGTTKTVFKRVQAEWSDQLAEARARREEDRLIYLSLNRFEQRRSFAKLPDSVRRDVKAFWGSFANAKALANELLYSAGDAAVILDACRKVQEQGIGFLDDRALFVHSSVTRELPPVLRVYLGCAARVYGEFEQADLVKIHIGSNKVSLMTYDDFDGRAIPLLLERIKITLGLADFEVFTYGAEFRPQPLYLKSRYLPSNYPDRERQVAFDDALKRLDAFDFSGYGPDRQKFSRRLEARGLRVHGFRIVEDAAGAKARQPLLEMA